jgi:ABC-2 type transport system permease protein
MIFLAALRKELMEQWRSYRLLITAAVLVAFGLIAPLTARYTPELLKLLPNGEEIARLFPPPTALDAVTEYTENISQFGVILALLMAMGAVAHEKERGTAAMVLVKPLPRWAFLTAKFAALGVTFAVSIAVAGAGCYYYTFILFEPLDIGPWVELNVLLLVFVLVYVALTLMCSVFAKSQAAAGGLAFALLIVLALPGALPKVGEYLPGQLMAWGAGLIAKSGVTAWPALWISVGLIAGALGLAWLAFERQEL